MTREGDVFRGVLPKASSDIEGMVYYLEAMDSSWRVRSLRSRRWLLSVPSSTRRSGTGACF